jgi:transcriptional regulator with XRE-family HTH domain
VPVLFHIGDVVRKWREQRTPRTSAEALARLAGIDKNTVSRFERTGKAQPDKIERIVAALGRTMQELYAALSDDVSPEDRAWLVRWWNLTESQRRSILTTVGEYEKMPRARGSGEPATTGE